MTPEQKRTFNTGVGSLFLVLGVTAWGVATFFSVTPHSSKPAPTLASKVDMASCHIAVGLMGFSVTERDKDAGTVELRQTVIQEDAQRQLMLASLAATACRMNLESFCMGDGCAEKGITMVLTPSFQEVKPYAAPAASPHRKPS